jgi:formiminoglutamase
VAEPANTPALFDRAKRFECQWRFDTELETWELDDVFEALRLFVERVEVLHLSIDLDVLPGDVMPAVSAPAARGVPLASVEALIAAILGTGKVAVVDLAEFNPTLDPDGRGARTAARLAWLIAKDWPVLAPAQEG